MKKLSIILILITLASCQRGKLNEPNHEENDHWYKYNAENGKWWCDCGKGF
jgi:hypothetical protein